jgi:hypothetical protein
MKKINPLIAVVVFNLSLTQIAVSRDCTIKQISLSTKNILPDFCTRILDCLNGGDMPRNDFRIRLGFKIVEPLLNLVPKRSQADAALPLHREVMSEESNEDATAERKNTWYEVWHIFLFFAGFCAGWLVYGWIRRRHS